MWKKKSPSQSSVRRETKSQGRQEVQMQLTVSYVLRRLNHRRVDTASPPDPAYQGHLKSENDHARSIIGFS